MEGTLLRIWSLTCGACHWAIKGLNSRRLAEICCGGLFSWGCLMDEQVSRRAGRLGWAAFLWPAVIRNYMDLKAKSWC